MRASFTGPFPAGGSIVGKRGEENKPRPPLHADRDAPAAVAEPRVDDVALRRAEGKIETDRERVVVARGQLPLAQEDVLEGGAFARERQLVADPGVAAVDLEIQTAPDAELQPGLELDPVELDVVEEMRALELERSLAPRPDDLIGDAQGLLEEGLGRLEIDGLIVIAGPGQTDPVEDAELALGRFRIGEDVVLEGRGGAQGEPEVPIGRGFGLDVAPGRPVLAQALDDQGRAAVAVGGALVGRAVAEVEPVIAPVAEGLRPDLERGGGPVGRYRRVIGAAPVLGLARKKSVAAEAEDPEVPLVVDRGRLRLVEELDGQVLGDGRLRRVAQEADPDEDGDPFPDVVGLLVPAGRIGQGVVQPLEFPEAGELDPEAALRRRPLRRDGDPDLGLVQRGDEGDEGDLGPDGLDVGAGPVEEDPQQGRRGSAARFGRSGSGRLRGGPGPG